MIKRTITAVTAAGALLALTTAPASAQQDICVTYDFAGSEFCVVAETLKAAAQAETILRNNDRCVTYDFAGSEFCVFNEAFDALPVP